MKRFVFSASLSSQEGRADGLDLDSVLLGNPEDALGCEVVTEFLHHTFEAVVVASHVNFSSLRSLLCGPVQVTFVLSVISVISVR